jgi:hypothetical protein
MKKVKVKVALMVDANARWSAHGESDQADNPDWSFVEDMFGAYPPAINPRKFIIEVMVEVPSLPVIQAEVISVSDADVIGGDP